MASTYCTITINLTCTRIRQYSDAGTVLSPLGASIIVTRHATIQKMRAPPCLHLEQALLQQYSNWQSPTYTKISQSNDAGTALTPLGASIMLTIHAAIQTMRAPPCLHWSKHCGKNAGIDRQPPTYTNIRQSSNAGTALSPLGACIKVTIQ